MTDVSNDTAISIGSSTARILADRFADTINVLDWGAIGNGIINDTISLQNAINAAAGNASILIPAGYTFNNSGLTIPANSDIILNGTLFLISNSGQATSCITHTGNNSCIRGIGTINGNAIGQTGTIGSGGIVNIGNLTNLYWDGITVTNTRNWCFNITNSTDCLAYNCKFTEGGSSNEYAIGCVNCWFDKCYINGVDDLGCGFYGGCSNCGIVNSYVTNANDGIFVLCDNGQPAICNKITIANNQCISNNGNGITVSANIPNVQHTGIMIFGNTCQKNSSAGIQYNCTRDGSIIGNICTENTYNESQSGDIYISGSVTYAIIANNFIYNTCLESNKGFGIYAVAANRLLITGNYVYDDQTTQTIQGCLGGYYGAYTYIFGNYWGATIGSPDQFNYSGNFVSAFNADYNSNTFLGDFSYSGLANFQKSFNEKTTDYPTLGLSFGYNQSGGQAESDIVSSSGGMAFYTVNNIGTIVNTSLAYNRTAYLDGSGNFETAGYLSTSGGGTSGANITSGISVPTAIQPAGSIYLRTGGTSGARLYVSAGGGTWNAVPGV